MRLSDVGYAGCDTAQRVFDSLYPVGDIYEEIGHKHIVQLTRSVNVVRGFVLEGGRKTEHLSSHVLGVLMESRLQFVKQNKAHRLIFTADSCLT
jgi:hypothetical protein